MFWRSTHFIARWQTLNIQWYFTTIHLHEVEPSWVTPAEPVGLDWRILDQLEVVWNINNTVKASLIRTFTTLSTKYKSEEMFPPIKYNHLKLTPDKIAGLKSI